MKASGTSANSTAIAAERGHDEGDAPADRAVPLMPRLRLRRTTGAGRRASAALPAHAPDEQARQAIDEQRDDEEHQPDLDQRVQVEIGRRPR